MAIAAPVVFAAGSAAPQSSPPHSSRSPRCPAHSAEGRACAHEGQSCSYPRYRRCTCSRTPVETPGALPPDFGMEPDARPSWRCYTLAPNMGPLAPPELV
jgi:hypothetical protein